jgi:hypothetical protein
MSRVFVAQDAQLRRRVVVKGVGAAENHDRRV